MPIPVDLATYCADHDTRARDELFAFLRIPSVSARSEHKPDCAAAAQFVADALTRLALAVNGSWRWDPASGAFIVEGQP